MVGLLRSCGAPWAVLGLAVLFSGPQGLCQAAGSGDPSGAAPRQGQVLVREMNAEVRLSVDRGFRYLLRNQTTSGTFAGSDGFPVAVDALAGLAFLAGGHTDEEGPYTEALRRALVNLLKYQEVSGFFNDSQSRMYGHGFATLFLAELYGMTSDRAGTVRSALKRAVKLIEASQSEDGGWDYLPVQADFGAERRMSDTSVTVCQAMALRAARNLGIAVDTSVVDRARNYIRRAQNPDGSFSYRMLGDRRINLGNPFPRSAAGVCILNSMARPDDYSRSELRSAKDYLLKSYDSATMFQYYGRYYCVQAMFQAGGKYWAEYWPYVRKKLLGRQQADGSWSGEFGEVTPQATAMALIVLQGPLRFLPILER